MPNELLIRLTGFLSIFILMALWEVLAPRRPLTTSKPQRWLSNLSIVFLNTFVVRLLFSTQAVGLAVIANQKGWGVLHLLGWSGGMAGIAAVVILDLVLYLQHVMFHAVPILWRFHMMHHADLDVDVTTGARFHPVEIILSMAIKLAAVVLIGAPPLAVLFFEVLLNATAMFNHSNVRMPKGLDLVLRWVVVTPDMHRIHHSVIREETNSNFGFNLPWWDRLLGTYRADPEKGQTAMTLGLDQFRNPGRLTLPWMLMLPFVGETGGYPLGRGDRQAATGRKQTGV
jgi:sterol desaturase/sphingolipid hydroxylase (fatty acid hydroxylase superfamily)